MPLDEGSVAGHENQAKALEPDTAVAGIAARAANQVNGLDRLKTELSRARAGCDR